MICEQRKSEEQAQIDAGMERFQAMMAMISDIKPRPWWKPIRMYRQKELRLFVFIVADCSYYVKSLTKRHCFDVLIRNTPTPWWQPRIVGFQVWY